MKPRETVPAELAAVPPPELRLFTDAAREWHRRGEGLGLEVYGTREAWIAARHAWGAEHGYTIDSWFHVLCEVTLHRHGLAEMNRVFSEYLVEDDDWADPRLTG